MGRTRLELVTFGYLKGFYETNALPTAPSSRYFQNWLNMVYVSKYVESCDSHYIPATGSQELHIHKILAPSHCFSPTDAIVP